MYTNIMLHFSCNILVFYILVVANFSVQSYIGEREVVRSIFRDVQKFNIL